MNDKYLEIINIPHHVSKSREPMSRLDRAAQFAPYSALSGYENAIEETARLTDCKIELDEYEKERVNESLVALLSSPVGTIGEITYFRPDKQKSGGAYISVTGVVGAFDEVKREITLIGENPILIDDIINVQIIE